MSMNYHEMLKLAGPIGRFAPGDYVCPCFDCKQDFTGAKDARQCLTCALKELTKSHERLLTLARAARDLIVKIDDQAYELVRYDDANCDSISLRDDLEAALGIASEAPPVPLVSVKTP